MYLLERTLIGKDCWKAVDLDEAWLDIQNSYEDYDNCLYALEQNLKIQTKNYQYRKCDILKTIFKT